MATVTRENIGLLNDKIIVKINTADYLPNFNKAVKQFSKNASIPGFRKGMVPVGMVKKMHGQAIFGDEILKTVEKELIGYVQGEKLEIFGQPLSLEKQSKNLDFNQPVDYAFEFEIGLKPTFNVTPLENNKTILTKYKVIVTEEMVTEEVQRLQLKGGKSSTLEAVTSEDNVLNVTFEEADETGNVKEGNFTKESILLVNYFNAATQATLQGKMIQDSVVMQLGASFDEQHLKWILKDLGFENTDQEEAAQKYFKMTISKISLIEKRVLNEEFFKEIYPADDITTEEDFRNKLKEEIGKYWDAESRNHLHNELFEVLVHETPIDLPKDFLKRWLQVGGEKPKTAADAEKEFPSFDHQLRWTLISDKLIKENKLEVSMDEVKQSAKQKVLSYYGAAAADGAEWLDSYLDRLLQDDKFVDQTYREMITAKLFEWAESKVTIKEEEIKAEDFVNLPHKHHHHEH